MMKRNKDGHLIYYKYNHLKGRKGYFMNIERLGLSFGF